MGINIVLVEPEIPQNTGNIARTCAATGSSLHLVKPLGFSVNSKYLKRAGLDYWDLLDISYYDSFEELVSKYPNSKFFYSTTKARNTYTDMKFEDDCFLVFGKETAGLPEELLNANKETAMRIPMIQNKDARSLNLSNAVAIIAYEALRQIGFTNLV
ncbi:tRNA (uridine(34)/cytosine(34)/5-carboxymethylaminomethyluridine(34)-2'-O)-methyltransferase TrmL [Sporosalibacterium faouarense]|uniref:tRNA (uridine(34)/cytosine(34)/5- carboxymethylaminomethyluridine(34)-2'-O)- methyltransferase TrmL n=1 Tax=Sporosalibacterium faouarense TaxID=516123 RepID=UPI00141C9DE3|nr:tRNA (uridine(34)/cytosine(34)/5-carboxymethylaminomethyluridine(34)-2'-O)-methyltransferase TrmL [Sporosalibacterium faouarense]MTI46981.1 tRNA (uridine(34)/cytosine(34)/5-carboxymethylaminomethyluridine(34)-2'-O)-methyltransferase TrmL [Bacillota bacterium]